MIMTLDAVRDWVTARITQLRANGTAGRSPPSWSGWA